VKFRFTISRDDWVAIGLLVCSAALLFIHLGDTYLWQDEAETAVLSRNTFRYGFPHISDGIHTMYAAISNSRVSQAWLHHPWMQFYLAAVSFKVFGATTWAARAPFALLGLGSTILTWVLSRRLFREQPISAIACFLLITSVPFVLHMRQCRFYAPTAFFVLWSLLGYWRWLHRRPYGALSWCVGMTLLYYSNMPAAGALLIGCIGHWVGHGRWRILPQRFMGGIVVLVGLCTPWFIYARSWVYAPHLIDPTQVGRNLEYYIIALNDFMIPLGAATAYVLVQLLRQRLRSLRPYDPTASSLLWWTIGVWLVVYCFGREPNVAYVIGMLPLLYILVAWILVRWFAHRHVVLVIVTVLLACTTVLHRPDRVVFDQRVHSYLRDYLHEITHTHDDTIKGITTFLNERAQPEDTVKIVYGAAPLVYYTHLVVDTRPDAFFDETYPDWIVFQREAIPPSFYASPYFMTIEAQYDRIDTTIPDYAWGSQPDLQRHFFTTPHHLPTVVIYRKRS